MKVIIKNNKDNIKIIWRGVAGQILNLFFRNYQFEYYKSQGY